MEEEEGGRKRGQTEGESTEKEARNTPYSRFLLLEFFLRNRFLRGKLS